MTMQQIYYNFKENTKEYKKLSEIAESRGTKLKTISEAFNKMKNKGELTEGVDYIQGTNSKNSLVWLVDQEAFERVYATKERIKDEVLTEEKFKEILEKLKIDTKGIKIESSETQLVGLIGDVTYVLDKAKNTLWVAYLNVNVLTLDLSPIRCKCSRVHKRI